MKTILQRIITGLILIACVVAGILYLPQGYFLIALALVFTVAILEFASIIGLRKWYERLFLVILQWIGMVLAVLLPANFVLFAGCIWWLIALVLVWSYPKTSKWNIFRKWQGCGLSLLIFLPCFVGLGILHSLNVLYIFGVLFIIWATDIGAYFGGVLFGKHKLLPKISPKKTIEGFFSGLILALLVAIVYNFYLHLEVKAWVLLCLITSLFAVLGDLFESMLKRIADLKDSGYLLPGHGGVFDRIDSLTAGVPVFIVGLLLILRGF